MWPKAMWCWRGKFLLCIWGVFFICASTARAQVGQNYFSTDPANLYDWRAAMLNPSIGVFQTGALELGFKIFHLGFADENATLFKSGYAVLNLPRRLPLNLTVGMQSKLFTTPIFRETEIMITLSRHFWGVVSIGFGAGLRGISFQSDNFDLVDADDPVFAGGTARWQPDLSAGLTIIPFSPIIIGVGVKHLNKPSVSLIGNSMRLNPAITVGMAFNFGSLALHSSGSKLQHQTSPSPRGFLQLHSESIGMLQLGYEEEVSWLRSRLHLAGPIHIGYGFSYPLGELKGNSNGTHEAFFVYEFDRIRKIPKQANPPEDWIPFIPQMSRIGVVPQFVAKAEIESVDIFSKRLIREFDEEIDPSALTKLSQYDVGILDTSFVEKIFPFELQQIAKLDSTAQFKGKYSAEYSTSLANLRANLSANPVDVVIVTPETQKQRGIALGSYLMEAMEGTEKDVSVNRAQFLSRLDSILLASNIDLEEIKPVEEIVLVTPKTVSFTIFPIDSEANNMSWTLVIENAEGKRIHTITGKGDEQTEAAWNWQDETGNIIKPGFYRYFVEWRDMDGSIRRSAPRTLYARKLQRNIHVKITRKYEPPKEGANKIGIILK